MSVLTLLVISSLVTVEIRLASSSWQLRKSAILTGHPLVGRVIMRTELLGLSQMIHSVSTHRLCKDMRIVYLIQGEDDTSEAEAAVWGAGWDVFVITYRTFRKDAIFFPNSLLSEGRNVLLAAGVLQSVRQGCGYLYYVMLDSDVDLRPSWVQGVDLFTSFLKDWAPAVGVPAYEHEGVVMVAQGSSREPQAIFNFDNIFMAVHAEALPGLLPYDALLDATCSLTSQWVVSALASALFRNHVLVLPAVIVRNPSHSAYPNDNCEEQYARASRNLRAVIPVAAQSCFPDPDTCIVMKHCAAPMPPGATEMGFLTFWPARWPYLPWGTPFRKSHRVANYSNKSLADIAPCDFLLVHSSASGSDGAGLGLALLRESLIAVPYSLENWNAFALWIGIGGNPILALGLFGILRRLYNFFKLSVTVVVEQNIEDLKKFHDLDQVSVNFESMWLFGGGGAAKLLHAALFGEVKLGEVALATRQNLREFVNVLASGQQCDWEPGLDQNLQQRTNTSACASMSMLCRKIFCRQDH